MDLIAPLIMITKEKSNYSIDRSLMCPLILSGLSRATPRNHRRCIRHHTPPLLMIVYWRTQVTHVTHSHLTAAIIYSQSELRRNSVVGLIFYTGTSLKEEETLKLRTEHHILCKNGSKFANFIGTVWGLKEIWADTYVTRCHEVSIQKMIFSISKHNYWLRGSNLTDATTHYQTQHFNSVSGTSTILRRKHVVPHPAREAYCYTGKAYNVQAPNHGEMQPSTNLMVNNEIYKTCPVVQDEPGREGTIARAAHVELAHYTNWLIQAIVKSVFGALNMTFTWRFMHEVTSRCRCDQS